MTVLLILLTLLAWSLIGAFIAGAVNIDFGHSLGLSLIFIMLSPLSIFSLLCAYAWELGYQTVRG